MRFTALAVAGLAAALSTAAVSAEPVCVETMEHVVSILESHGIKYEMVPADKLGLFAATVKPLTGVEPSEVTAALIAGFDVPAFGLQTKDGCFSPQPIPLVQAAGVKA